MKDINDGLDSFTIKVDEKAYDIKPKCEADCTSYEVSTSCNKLFTLYMSADGTWKSLEKDVVPISEDLVTEIGIEILKHAQF